MSRYYTVYPIEELFVDSHPLAIVRCPNCESDYIKLRNSYCTQCGLKMYVRHDKQLERKCSRCNALSPKDSHFCRLCGKRMGRNDPFVYDARIFTSSKDCSRRELLSEDWRSYNYEFVDLGLSVLWGHEALLKNNKNDREPRKKSIWMNENTFKWEYGFVFASKESISYEKYKSNQYYYDAALVIRDNKEYIYIKSRREMILVESLFEKYDLINRRMGGNCRVPTKKEIEELLTRCKWEPESRVVPPDSDWYDSYINGFRITGPSGKSIFMSSEYYWTSSEASPGKAYAVAIFPPDRHNVETLDTIHPFTDYHSRNWDDLHHYPKHACWWPVIEK